ncbi:MAG: aminopeptidase [Deltaproteobacteria bacterium]|jgi:hypothetical protein|nr:aminopeptidase [Deltaproteobacteria bacterium]
MRRCTTVFLLPALVLALCAAGCGVRPISDSGYRKEESAPGAAGQAASPFYKGELSEFDVLGISPEAKNTEEEIRRALESRQRFALPKGSRVMLIQSGAMIPDEPMSRALGRYYDVSVFSGVPAAASGGAYASALRLAAAKAGCETIMVYWGILETAQTGHGGKIISWLPLVGGMVTDESQEMRIRLKTALVDVKSGRWEAFAPEPFQDRARSARYTREASDQAQVATLKAKAYGAAVEDVVKRYATAGRSN